MSLLNFLELLQDTDLATSFHESRYVYPLVEALHLLGLALSVGLIVITDLRLIGLLLKRVPAANILSQLRPWVIGGFVGTFLTGGLLFMPVAADLYFSTVFRLKFLVIVLAGLNALWFELHLGRKADDWGPTVLLPRAARLAGWASLTLWTTAIILGRLYAYYPGVH